MTNLLLLSVKNLKVFTDLNNSVDDTLLSSAVRIAQDYHLQRIIGTQLYQKLLVDANANIIAGDYKTLLDDYILDMLLWASYYEALESIYIRARNNGLLTPTGGENSEQADLRLYNTKRTSVKQKMEYYAERLTNYLIDESAKYPELDTNNKLYQQIPDYGSKYGSPIAFTNKVRKGRHYDEAKKAGLRVTDSRYPYLPEGSNL